MAAFPILLFPASRAASATCTASVWRSLIVCMSPACCAPPLVLLRGASQSDCGRVRIIQVPFLHQPAVCCNGAAAAKSAKLASAVAEGAHNAACCLQLGEVEHLRIPLVHLATSGAAVALQPDPFAAFVSEISRPAASVFPGMPPARDAGVVGVGQGFAAPHSIPAACPCSMTVTADQLYPSQFSSRMKVLVTLRMNTASLPV